MPGLCFTVSTFTESWRSESLFSESVSRVEVVSLGNRGRSVGVDFCGVALESATSTEADAAPLCDIGKCKWLATTQSVVSSESRMSEKISCSRVIQSSRSERQQGALLVLLGEGFRRTTRVRSVSPKSKRYKRRRVQTFRGFVRCRLPTVHVRGDF